MKKTIISVCIFLLLSISLLFVYGHTQSEKIASSVIRLHIIANSDTSYDQYIKLKVRNKIIEKISPKFKDAENMEEVKNIIKNNLNEITDIANRILEENNCSYTSTSSFGIYDFPMKSYANITLPKGKYEAVRVSLGNASGENWWCVMFPPLCFTSDATGKLDDTSKETLINSIGNSTYEIIDNESTELKVKYKFKLIEICENIKSKL